MKLSYLKLAYSVVRNNLFPDNTPFFCTYFVTFRCNARCIMCGIWKNQASTEMNLGQIETCLKKLPTIKVIRLTGGEPFLREDLSEIVSALHDKTKIEIVHITTNGLLKEPILNLIKNARYRSLHLKISLTGYGENHDRILQHPGAYKEAVETIELLKDLRKHYGFYLAINQTITDSSSYRDSIKIRQMCGDYNLTYLPVLAYRNVPLYEAHHSDINGEVDFCGFNNFEHKELENLLQDLIKSTGDIENIIERTVKRYYLKGLYNRLILNLATPKPRCVALRNHIRLLPNGDVPVCLYNPKIIGNILEDSLENIWTSPGALDMRSWVDRCKGCWAECEVIPSAIYSGDIHRGIL